jgi:hypothetical protein
VGLLDNSILRSDHRGMFLDLNSRLFGKSPEKVIPQQSRTLKLDDPRLSDAYRRILHKKFEEHNVCGRVQAIVGRGKTSEWTLTDEQDYEKLDLDLSQVMEHASRMCSLRKKHNTPWANSLGTATHAIRYWSTRVDRKGVHSQDDGVLDYYFSQSDVNGTVADRTLSIRECMHQAKNARRKFKDALNEAKTNGSFYELEVATARVEKRFPHLAEDDDSCSIEREDRIQQELKSRENKRTTQNTFRKLGRQIRGHVKPNSAKKSSLSKVTVPETDGTWTQIIGQYDLEDHLIQRNVEKFSLAGETPFGYSPLGKELGHTGDSEMAEAIHEGTLEHEALSDAAINAVVKQLRKHPALDKVLKPAVTKNNFKSAFNCERGKKASSYSGRGVEHYKACADGSDDGIADLLSTVHTAMMPVPLDAGVCPSRWKHDVDVLFEKIPGVSRSDKLRIIQLLEADLNQVLRIAFARSICRLAKEHEGIISKHQYGRAHKTCMTPVLNKLLTVQLIIQNIIEGIVFDNDAQGCYDRIISGIALACLRQIGYSKNSTRILGMLWSQL